MELFFRIATFLVIGALIAYAFFIGDTLRSGPIIQISSPAKGEVGLTSPVIVSGIVENATYASINDREIKPSLKGVFEEITPLPSGYAIIEIYARNARGRETHVYRYLYIEDK